MELWWGTMCTIVLITRSGFSPRRNPSQREDNRALPITLPPPPPSPPPPSPSSPSSPNEHVAPQGTERTLAPHGVSRKKRKDTGHTDGEVAKSSALDGDVAVLHGDLGDLPQQLKMDATRVDERKTFARAVLETSGGRSQICPRRCRPS